LIELKIPVYKPHFNGKEKEYVNDCLDTSWISSKGKYVSMFEQKFSSYIGTEYGVAVSNGTAAIHLALLSLGIGIGDEVIVPSLTYIATVNPVRYVGAIPVFADSVEKTWQINPVDVERKITTKTRAIIVVHLYGHPVDMDEIVKIAKKYNLFIIEDCAEAIGTEYNNKRVGTFGDIGCFSFFGNKTITTGEGGMLLTSDKTIYKRAISLKGQGLAMYREYWHDIVGYNYRMTNICAAIGCAQLESIDEVLARKSAIAKKYINNLEEFPVEFLIGNDGEHGIKNTYWMCTMLLEKNGENREDLRGYMREKGIETRPAFYPVHTMPMYSQRYQKLPIAESLGWRGMNLPSFPDIKDEEIDYVTDCISDYLKKGYK